MSLSNAWVQSSSKIPQLFSKIRDGQAPDRFTHQLLVDWGFKSTNDRPFIKLLKEIGFLNGDGVPTKSYHDYRDHSRSKAVLGAALKDAYSDIFLITANPTNADLTAIQGKFKSFHNASDNVSSMMANTFLKMVELADLDASAHLPSENPTGHTQQFEEPPIGAATQSGAATTVSGLHYNIQIHLPATKDLEVYNAIFRSLKEHLIE